MENQPCNPIENLETCKKTDLNCEHIPMVSVTITYNGTAYNSKPLKVDHETMIKKISEHISGYNQYPFALSCEDYYYLFPHEILKYCFIKVTKCN